MWLNYIYYNCVLCINSAHILSEVISKHKRWNKELSFRLSNKTYRLYTRYYKKIGRAIHFEFIEHFEPKMNNKLFDIGFFHLLVSCHLVFSLNKINCKCVVFKIFSWKLIQTCILKGHNRGKIFIYVVLLFIKWWLCQYFYVNYIISVAQIKLFQGT